MVLDGPLGTRLRARGVPTPLPGWSAHALLDALDVVSGIHAEYAAAGATVHTTNTFRARPPVFGKRWREMVSRAVRAAREAVPGDHAIAGSIAPLADCYRPDLSPIERDPAGARAAHRDMARALAEDGCDILLCETFPHVGEAWIAIEEAVATGVPAWVAFTPGPSADLLTPDEVARAAEGAIARGASSVLVNCLPAREALPYVRALDSVAAPAGVLVGAYANAGRPDAAHGWETAPLDPAAYAELARAWRAAGATIVGGCCGTGPRHIAALGELPGSSG